MFDVLKLGGPVMIPLGLLSLVAVSIILERLWALRRSRYLSPNQVGIVSQYLAKRDWSAAKDYCQRHNGPFPQLVRTLVDARSAPYDELREMLEDTARLELKELERGLGALSTIVAGAPLLGLLGTVLGMMKIFDQVAEASGQVAEQLSSGISQALITTATGLIIAIPLLFTHALLENRAESILHELESTLLDLIHMVRRPVVVEEEAV